MNFDFLFITQTVALNTRRHLADAVVFLMDRWSTTDVLVA